MIYWRRGGKEKQLKDDAHQRNSKVEMSLEWSQIAHKTQRSLSCPPMSQRQQWEHIQEIAALPQFSFVLYYVNMHKLLVFQLCLFMWLKKNKVKYFTHKKFNMRNCKWKYCFKIINIYACMCIKVWVFPYHLTEYIYSQYSESNYTFQIAWSSLGLLILFKWKYWQLPISISKMSYVGQ